MPETADVDPIARVCGGARLGGLGGRSEGCGTALRYESTANGLEFWRCPSCGNPHWWPVSAHADNPAPREDLPDA